MLLGANGNEVEMHRLREEEVVELKEEIRKQLSIHVSCISTDIRLKFCTKKKDLIVCTSMYIVHSCRCRRQSVRKFHSKTGGSVPRYIFSSFIHSRHVKYTCRLSGIFSPHLQILCPLPCVERVDFFCHDNNNLNYYYLYLRRTIVIIYLLHYIDDEYVLISIQH